MLEIIQMGCQEGLCCTLNDSKGMDETSPRVDLLCKPTHSCSFLDRQQRFTENATESRVVKQLHSQKQTEEAVRKDDDYSDISKSAEENAHYTLEEVYTYQSDMLRQYVTFLMQRQKLGIEPEEGIKSEYGEVNPELMGALEDLLNWSDQRQAFMLWARTLVADQELPEMSPINQKLFSSLRRLALAQEHEERNGDNPNLSRTENAVENARGALDEAYMYILREKSKQLTLEQFTTEPERYIDLDPEI